MQNEKNKLISIESPNFARYEMQHALTDGIFEPVRKIKDARLRVREVIRETRLTGIDEKTGQKIEERVTLTFIVPYQLNPQAESILLAILKLSGMDGLRIEPDQPMLPVFDTAEGGARQKATVQTTTTQYRLLKEAGMGDGKEDYRLLKFYLELMSRVAIKWQNHGDGWEGSSNLMGYAAHADGDLVVRLNWRLAGVILGSYEWATIDLNERHILEKDPSKTLHRWLSAHLWKGKSEYIKYERLIGHIWTQEATKSTQRWRLHTLKQEVLPEITKLPYWMVEMDKNGARISHLKEQKEQPRNQTQIPEYH